MNTLMRDKTEDPSLNLVLFSFKTFGSITFQVNKACQDHIKAYKFVFKKVLNNSTNK